MCPMGWGEDEAEDMHSSVDTRLTQSSVVPEHSSFSEHPQSILSLCPIPLFLKVPQDSFLSVTGFGKT